MAKKENGFTLLELLVVLVLLAVASSYVGPALWKTYSKNQERSVVQHFADVLHQLRITSRREGRAIHLPAIQQGSYSVKDFPLLPDGWTIEKASPLVFLSTGVTNGGSIKMQSDSGHYWLLSLRPLDGKPKIDRE